MINGDETTAKRKSSTFPAEVKKVGNSFYIRIPIDTFERMQLKVGDDLDVTIQYPEMIE